MDFGIPYLMELGSVENSAKLCQELGLQFLELNMNYPACDLEDLPALQEAAHKNGIYFTIHIDEGLDICHLNRRVRQAWRDTALHAIAAAKVLHAPILNMHLARGIYITLPGERVFLYKVREAEYREHLLAFRSLCEEAIGTSPIRVAVENTGGFAAFEKRGIELLLESPVFGLTLDIGHSHMAGNIDMDFYEKHTDRLLHMHAHDCRQKSCHLAFGDGEIDLTERLAMAEKAGARVVLEVKTADALTRTVAAINNSASFAGVVHIGFP